MNNLAPVPQEPNVSGATQGTLPMTSDELQKKLTKLQNDIGTGDFNKIKYDDVTQQLEEIKQGLIDHITLKLQNMTDTSNSNKESLVNYSNMFKEFISLISHIFDITKVNAST